MIYTVAVYLQTEGLTDLTSAGQVWTFDAQLTDPCYHATIDLSSSVVPNAAVSYTVGDAEDVQQFVFANAVVTVSPVSCPSLVFSLTN